jgi:hypothetical protein
MVGDLNRLLVWTLAAAFILSGGTWRQCVAEHSLPANLAGQHNSSERHHSHPLPGAHEEHSGSNDHHANHHDHGDATSDHIQVSDPVVPPADDHACRKCCSLCTTTSLLPVHPSPAVTFIISSIVFSQQQRSLFDTSVLIDPGIPKRIA